jgi:ATP-dependent Clp protease ATP-binding subunit ClpA
VQIFRLQSFITDRHLPDKAIDVIDEAGALRSASCPNPNRRN